MSHVRCSKCRGRSVLPLRPSEYVRLPRCRHCGRKMTADPVSLRELHYYEDRWRTRREVGRHAPKPCKCCGYSFPHARGRGYCDHNPRLTAEDLQQRHEGGSYA